MADDYTITARITAEDATGGGVRGARRALDTVEDKARSVSNNISGYLGRAFLLLGGASGIGYAIRGFIGLNSQIDEAQRGLAGMFTAFTGTPIARSLGVARGEIQGLREDARKGVGELSDYLQGYQQIVGVGLPSGVGLDLIREINRNAIAAGSAMRGQEGMRFATLDVVQASTAGVGDRTTPIAMAALRAAGITAEAFNKLDPGKRLVSLNEAFKTFGPAVELMGKSWSAQSSTFLDNIKSIAMIVTRPLFDSWLDRLRRANVWLEANRDRVAEIAEVWGVRLVGMWDTLIERAGTYAAIVAAASFAQQLPGVGAGVRATGVSLHNAFQNARFVGSAAGGGLGGLRAGVGGFLEALFPAVSRLAGPFAILTTAVLSVQGAMQQFPEALAFATAGGNSLLESLSGLGGAFASLTSQGSILNSVGAGLLYVLGGVGRALGFVVDVFSTLVRFIAGFFQAAQTGITAIGLLLSGDLAGAAALKGVWADRWAATLFPESTSHGIQGEQKGAGDLKLNAAKNITNINGPVTMHVKTEVNADPARVLVALEEGMDRLKKYKRQGSRLPVLT